MNVGPRMKFVIAFMVTIVAGSAAVAQVPTQPELNTSRQGEQNRPGYFFYAKPYEVTMTVNLWGEVPQQGVYIIPTSTDIIQLISFAGGPKERSNLEEVLLYRAAGKKDQKARLLLRVDVRDILEGRSPTVPLTPGDMIVVKKIPEGMSMQEWLTIVNTAVTLAVLGITIYNIKK